ncbi:hypothetical protein MYBA111488_07030 [Mycobacterium basiliense]
MVVASKMSVRNSTLPLMPVGVPVRLQCSVSENTRSMRAVWVCSGSGLTWRSPNFSAAGWLFCQASITWIRG